MKVTEAQRQCAISLAQASIVLLGPSGRVVEGRGLVLYRLTAEDNGVEAVQVWTSTPETCVLCVTDCGEIELYRPQQAWEQIVRTWSEEVAHTGGAAVVAETLTQGLQLDVQVHPALLAQAREEEQHAQLASRVLSALEQAGAAMLRSYERWLVRHSQSATRELPRTQSSVAWTGNPEQPGQVVTRGVLHQTIQDVVRESTALFRKGFGYGDND